MGQDRIFGTLRDPKDKRDFKLESLIKERKIIATTDTHIDYTAEMSPVKNQGSLGSCVAFAVCAVKEWQERKEKQEVDNTIKAYDLSEQWLYHKCKDIDCWPNHEGTSFRYAMKVLKTDGVPVEQGWSYNPKQKGKPEEWAKNVAKWYKCGSFWRIANLNELKTIVATEGPQPIGILCFTEIFTPDENGIVPLPANRKKRLGGHAIAIVGFSDDTQLIKFKNSWGIDWGIDGYGYISYDYYNNYCLDAWYFADSTVHDAPQKQKQKQNPSPKTKEVVVATKIKLFNTMKQLQQVHIVRNGKDTTIAIPGRQMATIMSNEMSGDVQMRLGKGLLERK